MNTDSLRKPMLRKQQDQSGLTLAERLAIVRQQAGVVPTASSATTREFAFQFSDFERVGRLIYAKAGISLAPSKQDMVYSRLSRRLRETGKKTFNEYLNFLENARDPAEWEHFVNALTTNLTSFFREPHHFPIFAEHLRKIASLRRRINIWCCAASTGEEPYSIAMTVADTFMAERTPPEVSILCSDIDTNVLKTGEKGAYAPDRVEKIPLEQLRRYFTRGIGSQEDMYCIKPELRRMTTFQRVNLLDPVWQVRGPLDVIFCRNVMIYFDKDTQHKILTRFEPLMQPDGLLFAGHSENFFHASAIFYSLGKTVYRLTKSGKS
ncbi:MAG: chemotaxis protein CheR [Betaproteobacteria bacterium]|nr:chemotaxis protein CheR [Betaproteobacteria bacterium]